MAEEKPTPTPTAAPEPTPAPPAPAQAATATATEEQSPAQAGAVSLADFARLKAENDALKAQQRASAEAIARMQGEARRKRFTELALGKGEHSKGNRWYGDAQGHVTFLEALTERFGEDSEQVAFYVRQQDAHAEQLRASDLFSEFGTDAAAKNDPAAALDGHARAIHKEQPQLTYEQAYAQATAQHPDLYDRYVRGVEGR